ncbi:Peptidase family M23 [Clostridium cavendishii DSM 21758]|uniref:Peptidase family M23 n=1 Tax=Clostridium cavendishii DSM 21758 TaxID=1121302 RepID=A0A1M6EHU7_9CLOT|nr:M23 family metallopeptidase [Clostridium cavendishii]SHI85045.1 Peptidase family M23 [Clostridium cavendishii DSM 21758]
MKKNRLLSLFMCITIAFSLVVSNPKNVQAKSKEEIQSEIEANKNKINNLENEQKNISEDKEEENAKLKEVKNQIKQKNDLAEESLKKVNEVQGKVDSAQYFVDEINKNITDVKDDIEKTSKDIDKKAKEQAEKKERLGERLREIYKSNFSDQVIYILITSDSLGDLINNLTGLTTVVQNDNQLIDEVKKAQEELESNKSKLRRKKDELEKNQKEAEIKRNEVKATQGEFLSAKNKYDSDINELKVLEDNKNQAINNMSEREKQIQREQEKLGEDNAKLEGFFNNLSKTESGQSGSSSSGQSGNNGNSGQSNGVKPSSGGFIRPVGGYISCAYGPRTHPVTGKQSFHQGVDLAVGSGTPIKAAKSGVVTTATYHYIYGNMIIVDHGGGYSTLYAHQSGFNASVGQKVNQGDIIGYVGSTGWSTGPHLHFEVRINGQHTNPMQYIN